MKLRKECKVREMAGEHVIVLAGRYGADMTRIVALNATSLYLWRRLEGRDFALGEVVEALLEGFEVDEPTARRDAEAWIGRLEQEGLIES